MSACLGRVPERRPDPRHQRGIARVFFSRVGLDGHGRGIVSAAVHGERCLDHEELFLLSVTPSTLRIEDAQEITGGCSRCVRWEARDTLQ